MALGDEPAHIPVACRGQHRKSTRAPRQSPLQLRVIPNAPFSPNRTYNQERKVANTLSSLYLHIDELRRRGMRPAEIPKYPPVSQLAIDRMYCMAYTFSRSGCTDVFEQPRQSRLPNSNFQLLHNARFSATGGSVYALASPGPNRVFGIPAFRTVAPLPISGASLGRGRRTYCRRR